MKWPWVTRRRYEADLERQGVYNDGLVASIELACNARIKETEEDRLKRSQLIRGLCKLRGEFDLRSDVYTIRLAFRADELMGLMNRDDGIALFISSEFQGHLYQKLLALSSLGGLPTGDLHKDGSAHATHR